MKQIEFVPKVLQWARERAKIDIAYLASKMKVTSDTVIEWEMNGKLSFAKAKKLASYTRTPLGYLFLKTPLSEKLPIPDFRTIANTQLGRPSPDLLEMIQVMQRRQEWMRDFLIEDGADPLPFLGKMSLKNNPKDIAESIRTTIGIADDWAKTQNNWTTALRHFRLKIEEVGILIFISGIVGNNTHRKLNPEEFRGFVMCDNHAPLIFINGSDAKSAQMFTIAHELAHVWIGKDGVSNLDHLKAKNQSVEQFCNKVAAELLVPEDELKTVWDRINKKQGLFTEISKIFKVSPIVAIRRCLDLRYIGKKQFFEFYDSYIAKEFKDAKNKKSGGDFWKTQNVRIGNRFGKTVLLAAKSGRLLYRDAYRLTGLKGVTFEKYAANIGLPLK